MESRKKLTDLRGPQSRIGRLLSFSFEAWLHMATNRVMVFLSLLYAALIVVYLLVPGLVVAEVTYLVGRRLGAEIEGAFLRSLRALEVEAPAVDDWPAIADLVERYSDFPLGGTDASVAVLADRAGTDLIVTLDRRHFGAIRSMQGRPFHLLPD